MEPAVVRKPSHRFERVYIEISNICNLRCDFCPEPQRKKQIMGLDLFKNIVHQLKDLTKEITLHVWGEPLSHPLFEDFVDHCEQVGMPIQLTTNGTLLNHKNRKEKILSPAIRQVNFSLQSFSANYPDGDLGPYLQNIFKFTREAFARRPDLYINYRLWNMGTKAATESGNRAFLIPIQKEFNYELTQNIDVAFKKSHLILNRLYLHFDSRFTWPSKSSEIRATTGFCHALKDHFAILSDGTIVPCCLDKDGSLPLGEVNSTVAAVLNSERARQMRYGFDQFKLEEDLCRRCTYIERFDKKLRHRDTAKTEVEI